MKRFKDPWRGMRKVPTLCMEVKEENRRREQLSFPARSTFHGRPEWLVDFV